MVKVCQYICSMQSCSQYYSTKTTMLTFMTTLTLKMMTTQDNNDADATAQLHIPSWPLRQISQKMTQPLHWHLYHLNCVPRLEDFGIMINLALCLTFLCREPAKNSSDENYENPSGLLTRKALTSL